MTTRRKETMQTLTETDTEALYLAQLEKWAKRVQMWHRTHKERPPVIFDKSGNAHWMNRAQRRKAK